jgi:hypothetical protein
MFEEFGTKNLTCNITRAGGSEFSKSRQGGAEAALSTKLMNLMGCSHVSDLNAAFLTKLHAR